MYLTIAVKKKKKSIMWCDKISQWRIGVHGGSGYTTSTVPKTRE